MCNLDGMRKQSQENITHLNRQRKKVWKIDQKSKKTEMAMLLPPPTLKTG